MTGINNNSIVECDIDEGYTWKDSKQVIFNNQLPFRLAAEELSVQ